MNDVSFEIILILVMQKKLIKEIKEIFSMHKKKITCLLVHSSCYEMEIIGIGIAVNIFRV